MLVKQVHNRSARAQRPTWNVYGDAGFCAVKRSCQASDPGCEVELQVQGGLGEVVKSQCGPASQARGRGRGRRFNRRDAE